MKSPAAIVAHGPGWLAVDKPAGLSVHNDPGNDLCSRVARFLGRNRRYGQGVRFDPTVGVHPIHRLDKGTSGVILLACRPSLQRRLSRMFSANQVAKTYLALVHGVIRSGGGWSGWTWPLTPRAAGRRHLQGKGSRMACETAYRLVEHSTRYSLLECRLVTGRTHQIRRHAALAGHPILGDRRYGSLRACRYLETAHGFRRIALHCAALELRLPGETTAQRFASPELPASIRRIYRSDQSFSGPRPGGAG